jgi:hypothetical protein
MSDFSFSFPINFIKKEERIVTGIATADNVDKAGDIVDFSGSEIAFKNWAGNIREMHSPIAVGKAISYTPKKLIGPDGKEYNAIEVSAYISKGAQSTWEKVLDGTLRAFSIGGKILKKEAVAGKMHNGRQMHLIKEYELGELSLVDNPANPLAVIDIVKFNSDTNDLNYVLKCCDDKCEYVIEKAKQPLRDPKGGLTAAGRRHFKQTEGANLKPGVKGPANTPEKMRRKGSFLVRFFTNPSGPMKKPNGKPTRLALSAAAWGEPVPQDRSDAAKLAAKGRRLLERYRNTKEKKNKSYDENDFSTDLFDRLIEEIEDMDIDHIEYDENNAMLNMLLDSLYDDLESTMKNDNSEVKTCECESECDCQHVLEVDNANKTLQKDENYATVNPMENSLTDNKISLMRKFIVWLMNEPNNEGLEKSVATETSVESEVEVEQVEENQMDIEVLKEALSSVIDQKLNDFATSLKGEVEESVNAKIEEVTKNFDAQKTELTQKLEATEQALTEQTAKVEEFAQAGAMKKSVDTEETEEVELKKSAEPKSVWNNVYLPQRVINSLGYKQ